MIEIKMSMENRVIVVIDQSIARERHQYMVEYAQLVVSNRMSLKKTLCGMDPLEKELIIGVASIVGKGTHMFLYSHQCLVTNIHVYAIVC
jgi:hypothetical protein